jgi:hypothetical protein
MEKLVRNKHLSPIILLFSLMLPSCTHRHHVSRSSLRTYAEKIPEVTTFWEGSERHYTCISSHYAQYPIFDVFDENYFSQYTLPDVITLRSNPVQEVSRTLLEEKISFLITEVRAHKNTFRDFILLQKKNFNRHKCCGLLVLKFKDCPLVLKLFMETPKTFINPYCKGIEPVTFFFMAGGSNRHVAGLTRIKNLKNIQSKIDSLPPEYPIIRTPRKWFWQPQSHCYIEIRGKYIVPDTILTTHIPSIYAIIADEIDTKENVILASSEREKIIMRLCKSFNFTIDPHTTNYVLHKESLQKNSISILDTEHFPSMVGSMVEHNFTTHTDWYIYLVGKYVHDTFGRLKNERRDEKLRTMHL